MDKVATELTGLQAKGLLRELTKPAGVDFASNDYLGFATHPEIRLGLARFLERGGALGATGSRLISGHSGLFEEVEEFLRSSFASDAALIFNSGYVANLGVMTALGGEGTEFFSDALNHASLIDGMRLGKGQTRIFAHNSLEDLEGKLRASTSANKVIVTESIFSMDGDSAPLAELCKLASRFGAYLVVDEAHGTGTSGPRGLGLMHGLHFDPERTVIVHTCGKALGAQGAFVCASRLCKRLLVNKARSFIYSTALPPLAVEHIRLSVERLLLEPERVERLRANAARFGGSHILPVLIRGNAEVTRAAARLRQAGIFVKAIRSPTVAAGQERLRITFRADHGAAELDRLEKILAEVRT